MSKLVAQFRPDWALLFDLVLSAVCIAQEGGPLAEEKPKPIAWTPKITISKETTWFTGPVGKDGFVEYLEALNQRYSEGVTVENNAAVLLYQALGPRPDGTQLPDRFFRRMGIEPLPDEGNWFQLSKAGHNAVHRTTTAPWTVDDFPEVADWLNQNEDAMLTVTAAVDRPRYFAPWLPPNAKPDGGMLDVLLPGVQISRDLARAFLARAMLHLGEGNQFDAWRDLMTAHRLGRLIGQGPSLIEQLVGIAIETITIDAELQFLASTKPSVKLLTNYRKQLQRLPARAIVADSLGVTERVNFLDTAQRVARGKITLQAVFNEQPKEALLQKFAESTIVQSVDWNSVFQAANSWYDRLSEAAHKTDYRDRKAALTKLNQEIKDRFGQRIVPPGFLTFVISPKSATETMTDLLLGQLLPGLSQGVAAEDRMIQRMQNLEIAFALTLWYAENETYPDSLERLVPKYLAEIPVDRFRGLPLKYQATEEGYFFFSVGQNEKDEEGNGDDLSVRMPAPRKAR